MIVKWNVQVIEDGESKCYSYSRAPYCGCYPGMFIEVEVDLSRLTLKVRRCSLSVSGSGESTYRVDFETVSTGDAAYILEDYGFKRAYL